MTDTVVQNAERMIRQGSKSFFAAARIFDPPTREAAFLLYAWCRHCDDRIDEQELGMTPSSARGASESTPVDNRLRELEEATRMALDGGEVEDPVFLGLRRVVETYRIPRHLPLELLEGFRMDVEGRSYRTLDECMTYCYHVAGVVGVMMAHVMGVSNDETLDRAADLGLAFQATNIARDVMDDAATGRIYLPLDWLEEAGVEPADIERPSHRDAVFEVTRRLLDEAERYYRSSEVGISRLRPRHAWAIAASRRVYRDIGRLVRERASGAWDRRLAIGKPRKLWLLACAAGDALVATSFSSRAEATPRERLWTRPRRGSA